MSISNEKIPIYKVNHLVGENIDTIYVFCGNNNSELDKTFQKIKKNISINEFKDPLTDALIFNEEELSNLRDDTLNIKVFFSSQQIFSDDNIGTIKLKIVNEFDKKFSAEEVYLFCMKREVLNPVKIYKTLTQNNKLPLTNIRLEQFLENILQGEDDNNIMRREKKAVYNYDDILALNISGKTFWVAKVLGQKFFIVENEYPFVCNPFNVKEYDAFIERASRKSLTTLNSHVLLSNGEFIGNNIYLCLAKDVLENAERKGLDELTTIRLYYPFLLKKHDIHSLSELNEKDQNLIDEALKMVNKQTIETFNSIDLFYDMYKERKSELNYKSFGIQSIRITLLPEYSIKIPLDIIFKLIHATEETPLIKFNPATRRENIYRLYADKLSKDGRKIPFLSRALIFKLMQTIGKTKSVAVYIQYSSGIKMIPIICEFEETGNIVITCEFDNLMSIEEIDDLFIKALNPLIEDVNNYLQQSGYSLGSFNGIKNNSTVINYLNYNNIIGIDKVIKIKPLIGCISSAFIVESYDYKKGIELRYKRVSNFNKSTSQEAYVIEKQKQKMSEKEIIEGLVLNYEMSTSEALQLYARLANELQVERGIRGKDIEIKINPGFKITIKVIHGSNDILVSVENINDILYLNTIPIFIDSLIRLTQDPESCNIPLKTIKSLCSKGEKREIVLEDIISASEESMDKQELPLIEGDDLDYIEMEEYDENFADDKDKMKSAFDLLYEQDEEEEDEESLAEEEDEESVAKEEERKGRGSKQRVYNNSGGASSSQSSGSQSSSDKSLSSFGSLKSDDIEGLDLLATSESKSSESKSEKMKSSSTSEELGDLEDLGDIEGLDELEEENTIPTTPRTLTKSTKPTTSTTPILEKEEEEKVEIIKNIPEEESELEKVSSKKSAERPEEERQEEPEIIIVKKTKINPKKKEKRDKEEEEVFNIDGLKLANPTPFFKKMVERDPVLFLTEESEKFNSYSRTCLSSNRVQPVILNEDEKQRIDKEMPGFLKDDDVVQYGSTPEKQNYYICPRYWCLKTNMPISADDVKAGKCGNIIPRNEKKVPKGAYVYEFFNPSQHGTQQKYVQHYPGFVNDTKSQKHPDNLCIPCCYKDANSEIQKIMKGKCIKPQPKETIKKLESEEEEDEESKLETGEKIELSRKELETNKPMDEPLRAIEKEEQYIQGPEKFPLDPGRWGYLPFQIQKFLHTVNADCQISKTNTNIKPNHPCLLRHGVIYNENQSFLSCIADVIFYNKKTSLKKSHIAELKERIINSLNIDNFVIYQNGNLVQSFFNMDKINDINIEKYKSSKLYKKYKEENKEYFKEVVNSFENFIEFLKDDNILIDYTYLWDILTMPNEELFPSGINLVILEIPENDSTNNISLICPTNHYSNQFYDARKKTLIFMKKIGKRGIFYEPIYSYTDLGKDKDIDIKKFYSEYDVKMSKTIRAVFKKLIKPILQDKCNPLSSITNKAEYIFERPMELSLLIDNLNKLKEQSTRNLKTGKERKWKGLTYDIKMQVLNYNNKVIGLLVENNEGLEGVVPCYPSSINPTYDYVFINDENIFKSYKETVKFLQNLVDDSKGNIKCKAKFKVVEDDVMIVGILTETNQFINVNPPEPLLNVNDSINIFNSNNYLIADDKTLLESNNEVDSERVEYITKLKLETNFWNVFRNTIRILLNEYENLQIRENIEDLTKNIGELYNYKLKYITKYLKELVGRNDREIEDGKRAKIIFDESYDYHDLNEIKTCIIQPKNRCEKIAPLCKLINDGNVCQLILPKYNLLNGANNEINYFVRMADEIIRYNRIKSFMFKPQSYASFNPLNYNLRENEIIVIQSMLNQEYFEGLIPIEINKFIKYNNYDSVIPIKRQNYSHRFNLEEEIEPNAINEEEVNECKKSNNKVTNSYWKETFERNFAEYVYDKTKTCSYKVIIDIIYNVKGKQKTIPQIRNDLINLYERYREENEYSIFEILSQEGKRTFVDQLKSSPPVLNITNMIYSDSYYLTHFDLLILLKNEKIPSFFIFKSIGQKNIYNNILGEDIITHSLLCYGNPIDKFVFIIVPALASDQTKGSALEYRIIKGKNDDNITFNLEDLNPGEGLSDLRFSLENKKNFAEYMRLVRDYIPKRKVEINRQKAKSKEKAKEEEAQAQAVAQAEDSQVEEKSSEPDITALLTAKNPVEPQIIIKPKKTRRASPKSKKNATKKT